MADIQEDQGKNSLKMSEKKGSRISRIIQEQKIKKSVIKKNLTSNLEDKPNDRL